MSKYEIAAGPTMQKCSYTRLDQTYNSTLAPVQPTAVNGVMIVPDWGPVGDGYSSLVLPGTNCSGYGTINTAYGGNGVCNAQYSTRSCTQ